MKKLKKLILTNMLISALITTLSCEKEKNTKVVSTGSSEYDVIPDNVIWDMDVNITSENDLRAKFKGGYVVRENIGNSKYSVSRIDSGLVIEFFEKNKNTGKLESVKGTINDLSEVFTAIDSVVFRSTKGYTLFTDTLVWNRKLAQISSECDVVMIKDNRDTLYGSGFITDDKFYSYEITRPRGKTFIEGSEKIK
ncbi:MAG TPA: hypothetical protein PLK90_04455 [Clostridiales bacterium]|nr:hypothetical protein [Clostridiales bacterium]HQP69632.1 hypothetical protein [Clostridiales bacterium]